METSGPAGGPLAFQFIAGRTIDSVTKTKRSRPKILRIRDVIALIVLLIIYHGYEVLCYIISNLYDYYQAVGLFAGAIFLGSLLLIYLHDFIKEKYDWDAMALQYVNSLRDDVSIPSYQIFKRLTRLVLQKGYWAIFLVGPVILGPFVITLLLRRHKTWIAHLFYAVSGSFFNALFWVAFMKGLGVFTWKYLAVFYLPIFR